MTIPAIDRTKRQLIVLGCSDRKLSVQSELPAVSLYDGPMYRVLRNYLREYRWPQSLSVAVLSAKYGLIGGLSSIEQYDLRMTPARAKELANDVTKTLLNWGQTHSTAQFVIGKDYARTLDQEALKFSFSALRLTPGGIGEKQHHLHEILRSVGKFSRPAFREVPRNGTPLYFLPDWDDFIDAEFDYERDRFSAPNRSERKEHHTVQAMHPTRMCDGILVSLAQNLGSKGLLRRVSATDVNSLAPKSVKEHFGLSANQWAFGDCGAFSYIAEEVPTISVERAVALYDLYDFDLGASVDHIPIASLPTQNGLVQQSDYQRRKRVLLTRQNAARFIDEHNRRKARFTPIGVIQGLGPQSYANQISEYIEMGYRHLAIGGLVPRQDENIKAIVTAIHEELKRLPFKPWIHLFGVFRPKLQATFRHCGISSFDSATYFRKAWLRSDQNYLAADGNWYAAIRVPPSNDPRVMKRLAKAKVSPDKLAKMERNALSKLRSFSRGTVRIETALAAVIDYDRLLERAELMDSKLLAAYERTLSDQPWRKCSCTICRSLGIDVLIFRGKNRNKSRGAHNTLMLYQMVGKT